MRALAGAVVAALALAAAASASERHPTLGELESQVMCPTCHTTLDQSSSPAALQIKSFIRRRIAAGDSRSEIKQKLVDEFGPSILAAPPKKGFDLLAWLLPIAGGLLAAVVLAVAAWRWASAREPAVAVAGPPLDPELERRLDAELERFEP